MTSASHRLYAYRWSTDQTFNLLVAKRGAETAQQCRAGAGFDRFLASVSRLEVVKEIPSLAPPDAEWAELRIVDTTSLEPVDAKIHIPPQRGAPVIVAIDDKQFTVAADAEALRLVATGCSGLGQN